MKRFEKDKKKLFLRDIITVTKMLLYITFLVVFFCQLYGFKVNYDSIYRNAIQHSYHNPVQAEEEFRICLPHFENEKDTLKIFTIRKHLINIYSGSGRYHLAYDEVWNALSQVDTLAHPEHRIQMLHKLASLYIIFEQYNEAHANIMQALEMVDRLPPHMNPAAHYRDIYSIKAWLNTKEGGDFNDSKSNLQLAMKYNQELNQPSGILYNRMQLAELYMMHDSLEASQALLDELVDETKDKNRSSHSLLYDHLGQLYMKQGDFKKAAASFEICIHSIDRYKNHLDNKVEVLDSLSRCYHYLGNDALAFEYSVQSKEMANQLFGSKSEINKALFEIKNEYKERLEQNRVTLLEQKNRVLVMETIMYVAVLLLVIIALIIRSRIRSRKHKLVQEKQAFEKKKQSYELESKNKELLSTALQLIERDTLLDEIGQSLKSMSFVPENKTNIASILSSIKANKSKKWDEFELYFTSINQDFYDQLTGKYPKLSPNDLKICALIKLGLSSKQMADIMGIEVDSINTSRSRIRKKMGLSREVNLTDFLQQMN